MSNRFESIRFALFYTTFSEKISNDDLFLTSSSATRVDYNTFITDSNHSRYLKSRGGKSKLTNWVLFKKENVVLIFGI